MKRTILNLGAIVMAFVIGLAINNACADNLGQLSDSELRSLVSQLQQEVNSLKQKVAELESKLNGSGGSPSSSDGGFVVDGIHFGRNGFPDDKIKQIVTTGYYIIDGKRTDSEPSTSIYEYDTKGRICRQAGYAITYSDKSYTYIFDTYNGTTKTHSELVYTLQ